MDSTKTMKSGVSNLNDWIEIDKDKILKSIDTKGKYETKEINIKSWDGEKNSNFFVGHLIKNNFSYLGVLNKNLRRQNYGLNTFDNGDSYFGYFDEDSRAKHGAYFWKPSTQNRKTTQEMYHGYWRENMKDGNGTYVWITEGEKNTNFDDANFDAFIGVLERDNFKRGCYLKKYFDDYYVYYGKFDENGLKTDDNAFFYTSKQEKLVIGKLSADIFLGGYFISFKEDGTISNILYCEFDKDENPIDFKTKDEIDNNILKEIQTNAINFRTTVLVEDYFGQVYKDYKELCQFIKNDMKDLSNLDDSDGYSTTMKMGSAYNDITIFREVEKVLKK